MFDVARLAAALSEAVSDASQLPVEERVAFIGRHLVAQADGKRPERRAAQRIGSAEVARLEEVLGRAVNGACDEPGSARRNVGRLLEAEATHESAVQSKERYESAAVLRRLLTHDEARGGVAIRLLRARWLLEFFQSPDNARARLEHRQQLERERPDAFVEGEMLERVLAEVESGNYMVKAAEGGGYTDAKRRFDEGGYVETAVVDSGFPSACALSHMWLAPEHPDPHGRNLRDEWLPALEWYYSERVRELTCMWSGDEHRAEDATGAPLTDEAVREAADFGIFIDLSSIPQKEGGKRTDVEDALFRHALDSLDVIYAHRSLTLFLSTRLPAGVNVSRGYYDRGWTNFECSLGQLIKPDGLCIDIGLFTVDKACMEYATPSFLGQPAVKPLRIGTAPVASRSVSEVAQQGSYGGATRGLLGALVGSGRRAPLSPEAFAEVLATKQFTNGADAATVVALHRKTAQRLLGSRRALEYRALAWGAADYLHLGEALRYCGTLETLKLEQMDVGDADAAAVVAGLASTTSLQTLKLGRCTSLTALPDVSSLASLQTLSLCECASLTALPDVSSLTSLQTLDLSCCESLASLPDVSSLTSLQTLDLGCCESLTALPDVSSLASLQTLLLGECTSLAALPDVSSLTSLQTLELRDCTSIMALPDVSSLTLLQKLDLSGCSSLTALPDLKSLASLRKLWLTECTSLAALPDVWSLPSLSDIRIPDHL